MPFTFWFLLLVSYFLVSTSLWSCALCYLKKINIKNLKTRVTLFSSKHSIFSIVFTWYLGSLAIWAHSSSNLVLEIFHSPDDSEIGRSTCITSPLFF